MLSKFATQLKKIEMVLTFNENSALKCVEIAKDSMSDDNYFSIELCLGYFLTFFVNCRFCLSELMLTTVRLEKLVKS